MSNVQAQFDDRAIALLPIIQFVIQKAPEFEANQMKIRALQAINDADKPIDTMTDDEKKQFSAVLLELFIWRRWLVRKDING